MYEYMAVLLQVGDEEEVDVAALKAELKAREKEEKKSAKRKRVRVTSHVGTCGGPAQHL